MDESTDQIAGAVFRALTDRGHEAVERAVVDAYAAARDEVAADRERLSRTVFAELLDALDRELDGEEQVAVLTAAVEDLVDRFSTVIDAAPVAICAVDGEGRVRLWNPAAERTFGRDRSAVLGRSFGVTWADASDEGFDALLDRLRRGERIVGQDTRHRRPDGALLDTRVWAAPIHERGDGAAFVVLDVTERRGRRQRLAVLNRVLRHNVRNDVNVARGHVDRAAARLDDEAARRSLDVARRRLDDLAELSDAGRLIERVADADRTEAVRLDLVDVVRDRLAELRRTYPDCEVRTTLPDGAPVRADQLLPHAVDNVLENAVAHNDAPVPRVCVDLSMADTGGQAVLRIADDGPGLPPVERRVLEAGAETQLTHSTGLGLWLTNWIVRVSNGRVAVDTGDNGTTVILELPAA
ncbi:PAS domain-containing protein [Haloplanus salinarum]|uniref:PAS domain-containing protein n=1 Tax=Haloplanus salinarum TaxID=1912324 RepID=UPI00214CE161|nr:PAS domain-containing protein [Haloplanus salinarum]